MSLFDLSSRKQLPVEVNGQTLTVYAPSALNRCEYLQRLSKAQAANPDLTELDDNAGRVEQFNFYASMHQITKSERQYHCFLVAACLQPGTDESFENLLKEVESQPDDVLQPLVKAALQVSDLLAETVKD